MSSGFTSVTCVTMPCARAPARARQHATQALRADYAQEITLLEFLHKRVHNSIISVQMEQGATLC